LPYSLVITSFGVPLPQSAGALELGLGLGEWFDGQDDDQDRKNARARQVMQVARYWRSISSARADAVRTSSVSLWKNETISVKREIKG
jgi:hypothetical protein